MISVPSARNRIPAAPTIKRAHRRVMPSMALAFDRTAATTSVASDSGTVTSTAAMPAQIVRSMGRMISQHSGLLKCGATSNKESEVPETLTSTAVLEEEAAGGQPVVNDLT